MKLNLDKKTRLGGAWLLFDMFMVVVACINLFWIVFDWVYSSTYIQTHVKDILPWFYELYAPINADFIRYDLYFVAFFLTEFCIRWIIAIVKKEFYRWFFYPFVYWYDLLGCIPIGGFRWLRFLRIVVVAVRLQRLGLIRVQDWTITRWLNKYYEIFVEELSDRIVVNVIKEIQAEIKDGHQVSDNIMEKVVDPHKSQLIEIIAERAQRVVEKNFNQHQEDIEKYVRQLVKDSSVANAELKAVQKLPVFGNLTITMLEKAMGDVIINILTCAVDDFINATNFKPVENLIDDGINGISESGKRELERIVSEIILESLEIIKGRVEIQRWKLKYATPEGEATTNNGMKIEEDHS